MEITMQISSKALESLQMTHQAINYLQEISKWTGEQEFQRICSSKAVFELGLVDPKTHLNLYPLVCFNPFLGVFGPDWSKNRGRQVIPNGNSSGLAEIGAFRLLGLSADVKGTLSGMLERDLKEISGLVENTVRRRTKFEVVRRII